jgi:hypothetical protein
MFDSTNPLLQDYTAKAKTASEMSASATTLPDMLKAALNAKLADSPIVKERSQAAETFLSELGNAPTRVMPEANNGVIFDPMQMQKLISARRAGALSPLINANNRYDLLAGNASDIIGATTNAYKSQAQLAQGGAEIAGNLYRDTLDRLMKEKELGLKAASLSSSRIKESNKLQQKQNEALNSITIGLDRIEKARAATVKGASGFWPGVANFTQSIFGGGLKKDTATLRSALSNLNQGIFETSGKAFTKAEAELLAGKVGKVKDDPDLLNSVYDSIESDLLAKQAMIVAGQYINPEWGVDSTDTSDTGSEWEVVSY